MKREMADRKTPTNTTEQAQRDPMMLGWVMGGAPRAIEAQEAEGQRELVESDVLPTEGLESVRAMLEAAGGAIGAPVKGDPLFTDVTLPSGWAKKPTDHSMWSDLVDEAGKARANIFYKAAFYDRKAFIGPAR